MCVQSAEHRTNETGDARFPRAIKEVDALQRLQPPASTEVERRQSALSEADREQPGLAGYPPPHLLNGQDQFLVLVRGDSALSVLGETREECESVSRDGPADLDPPVPPWPDVGSIPPDPDPG
jgi:hypothetical protein